jgi:hypothetical protein
VKRPRRIRRPTILRWPNVSDRGQIGGRWRLLNPEAPYYECPPRISKRRGRALGGETLERRRALAGGRGFWVDLEDSYWIERLGLEGGGA